MKYIGEKENGVTYKKRRCAYAIIVRKEDAKIAIVEIEDEKEYFLFGGGIEANETHEQALKREMLEEAGYTIKNITYFNNCASYLYIETKGYLDIEATTYIVELDEKVVEPIEKDHKMIWIDPKEYQSKMYCVYQGYILEQFIERMELSER